MYMNIVIAGPCGVGKSEIGRALAEEAGLSFLEFDELRADEMGRRREGFSPCSVSQLDLRKCLPPVLNALCREFVLDIGGDTVFRRDANNSERREQVLWLKRSYCALLVVLTAERETLLQRFSESKHQGTSEFDGLWLDWKSIGEPYWLGCADKVVDTTSKSIEDSIMEIGKAENR